MQKKLDDRTIRNLKPPPSGRLEIWDQLLPGFGLRITENDVRTYFLMYRTGFGEGRKQRRYRLGDAKIITLTQAREAARSALNKVERGLDPAEDRLAVQGVKANPDSFAAAATTYLERYVKKNTRPSTYRETRRIFDVDLIPAWGPRPMTALTREDMDTVLEGIADRGAPVQANRVLARLRTFFNWAVDKEYLSTSPVARIKPPTKERTRDRALGDDEIRWFWQAAGDLGWPFGPVFRLLLVTAQRRDEVAGMAWSELELGRRIWTIPRYRAKNDRAHDVALSQLALEVIAELPKVDDTLVFTTSGNPVSGFSRAKRRLDQRMEQVRRKELSLPDGENELQPSILHDLRRTATTRMAGIGIPPHVVDRILNHTGGTINGVAAVYNRHGYEPERAMALETLGDLVSSIVRPVAASNVVRLPERSRIGESHS